jgi:predicted transposase/invertase (TIGR01784 family)
MKFADPKNDVSFRKLFGNEKKKDIVISFLNSILKLSGEAMILDVEFLNTFQLPDLLGYKSSIIDVKVKDKQGNTFIIEMQQAEVLGFDKRVQYYVTKEYSSQIKDGENYSKLNPVILVGILSFDYFQGEEYLSKHTLLNENTLKNELRDISFYFIELPKFNKSIADCKTLVDKWIFLLKNAKNFDIIPEEMSEIPLLEALKELDKMNWSQEEKNKYDYFLMREQDEKGKIELAEKRNTIEIAKKLKNINTPFNQIAEVTGLSIHEIERL